MAKLLEKNGAEMCAALVSVAGAVRGFLEDEEFIQAFQTTTKKGIRNNLHGIAIIYADLVPILFGDKHLKDTLSILAVVEGKPIVEMLNMNGVELLKDAMEAWREQIQPFFQRVGVTV